MNEKFSDLLKAYLSERDRQKSGYYDNLSIGQWFEGVEQMADLGEQMDALIHGVKDEQTN